MQVKFCGLRTPADVEAANRLHPDMVGFVFAPGSCRRIDTRTARLLKSRLDPSIRTVGVFVDQDPEGIEQLVNQGIIDMIQLHGSESEELVRRLRHIAPVIRAFRIRGPKDLQAARNTCASLVLLDAGAGEGVTFDWSLIRNFGRPYLLAGGLTPENAGEAAGLQPWGLDVSSGIETRGTKDPAKMEAFLKAVRQAQALRPARLVRQGSRFGWLPFLTKAAGQRPDGPERKDRSQGSGIGRGRLQGGKEGKRQ